MTPIAKILGLFILHCGVVALSTACQSPPPTSVPPSPQMPQPPSSIPSSPQMPQPPSSIPSSPQTPPLPSRLPQNAPSMPSPSSDSSSQDREENQPSPMPESIPTIPNGEQGPDDGWESSNEIPSDKKKEDVEQTSNAEDNETTLGKPSSNVADRELDEALDVFDGEILSGRADIMTRANETAVNNEYEEQSVGHESEKTGRTQGPNEQGAKPSSVRRRSPTMTTASLPPAAPIPPDIPDAKDDGVVARQLREAALAETDSELREKLWDEYRRYTESR